MSHDPCEGCLSGYEPTYDFVGSASWLGIAGAKKPVGLREVTEIV